MKIRSIFTITWLKVRDTSWLCFYSVIEKTLKEEPILRFLIFNMYNQGTIAFYSQKFIYFFHHLHLLFV